MTGGTGTRNYTLSLYEGDPNTSGQPVSDVIILGNSEGNTNNNITWQSGQTSVWFAVRFKGAGSNRVFDVGNAVNNEFADTDLNGFTVQPKPALNLTLSPASTSYTVGQSVTATITGGITGETYYPSLYNGTASDANDISLNLLVQGVEHPGNTVVWSSGTTQGQWVLQFTPEAVGANRRLGVSNHDFSHEQVTGLFTVVCPAVSISATPSLTIASGGSLTLTASGATSYTWSNGVQSSSITLTNVTSVTTLSVTGTSGTCSATADGTVRFTPPVDPCAPYVPRTIIVSDKTNGLGGTYTPGETYQGAPSWVLNGNQLRWNGSGWEFYQSSINEAGITQAGSVSALPCGEFGGYGVKIVVGCGPLGGSGVSVAITATPAPAVAIGQRVTLTASGADSYTWSNGMSGSAITVSNVTSASTLSVTGTTGQCSATASTTVSVACDQTIIADAVSITQSAILGPDNCQVQLTGSGFGTGYTITGPDGYVFSAVYRKVGSYAITGLHVKQPGAYTFKVSYQNACGEISDDTITYVVTGTACK
ncbi:hypothetical protein BLX24_26925 [Arsenicibacter rosenii]|uniref:Ig-like domain-containing protein n=1 Tax=Arsenicibacter rosenii TaxID=1750698 RepID=A0A1S2VCM9_9BACT|nr:hypothetical protein BLX24_26925 [Arsenicibacter rosenii]